MTITIKKTKEREKMKKTKWSASVITVLVILVSILLIAGCSITESTETESDTIQPEQSVEKTEEVAEEKVQEEETEQQVEGPEEGGAEEKVQEKIEIVDDLGNQVILEKPAEKVIVFAPSILEVMDELGAMDKVIGVDNWSIDSGEPLAEGFEGFGDYQGFNMEKIAEAQPDLIIALSGNPQEDMDRIKDLGVSIYISEASNFEETYEGIEKTGMMIGMEQEALELSETLKTQVDAIYDEVKDIADEDRPKVFYEIFDEPLWSAGSGTFIDDMIEKAGGINIVSLEGISGYAEYSLEKLIEMDPDVMIAGDGGMYEARTEEFILGDSRFSSLDAVINERVYIVPENPVVRPNHNSIKGLEMFARAIHPDIFGEFEIIE